MPAQPRRRYNKKKANSNSALDSAAADLAKHGAELDHGSAPPDRKGTTAHPNDSKKIKTVSGSVSDVVAKQLQPLETANAPTNGKRRGKWSTMPKQQASPPAQQGEGVNSSAVIIVAPGGATSTTKSNMNLVPKPVHAWTDSNSAPGPFKPVDRPNTKSTTPRARSSDAWPSPAQQTTTGKQYAAPHNNVRGTADATANASQIQAAFRHMNSTNDRPPYTSRTQNQNRNQLSNQNQKRVHSGSTDKGVQLRAKAVSSRAEPSSKRPRPGQHINTRKPNVPWPKRMATAKQCQTFATIADLPDEVLESIFEFALKNKNCMEVNEWFRGITGRCLRVPDDVNRSVLYMRQNESDPFRFYRVGLPILYSVNTWVLPLNYYTSWADWSNKKHWGQGPFALQGGKVATLPTPNVIQYVHSLVLHDRDGGDWRNAIGILKPLVNLTEITFDVRVENARYDGIGELIQVDAPEVIKDILKMKGIPANGKELKRVALMHDSKSSVEKWCVGELAKWLRREHEPEGSEEEEEMWAERL